MVLSVIINLLITTKVVFAISPPVQISPNNNSQVSSSKLTWETPTYQLYPNNPYRIQVDDNSNFSSVYRDYNTKNTYYTPVLTDGIWYWKVKAKDSSGTWSDWSSVWSFTLVKSTSTPTSTPSSTTSSNPSSFTISNIPSQINSDQSLTTSVNLSLPSNPNTTFYLKGAFKKSDGSNYFGLTKVSGNWVKNGSSYSNQYPITTNSSGNWSGNLEAQPDSEDSGLTGSGDYIFKVARYTSSGSGPSWSNESNIEITKAVGSNDLVVSEYTPSPSANSANKSFVSQSKVLTKASSIPKAGYQIAAVAGATDSATPSIAVSVKNQKKVNPFLLAGIFLVFAGFGSLGYIYLRKNEKIP